MSGDLRRDIRILKVYALTSTLVFAGLILSGFSRRGEKVKFEEIDVQRINVVEKDGKLRLVISNKTKAPDAMLGGKVFKRQGGNSAGFIFFNDEGDEDGGLVYGGQTVDGKSSASAALLFDQYHQDQTVGIMYDEEGGRRQAGLHVWDRSETPLVTLMDRVEAARKMPPPDQQAEIQKMADAGLFGARRVFVGKERDRAASIVLSDPRGKPRLRLAVDSAGAARIEFLDAEGKVTNRYPDNGQTPTRR